MILHFTERQLRVAQCAVCRPQLRRKPVCERLGIGNFVSVVEIFAEPRCISLQVQRFQAVLFYAQTSLIEITELLFGLIEALVRRSLIPLRCFGIIDRYVVHAIGMDACNIVLRFRIAIPGRYQPALQ